MAKRYIIKRSNDADLREQIGGGLDDLSERAGGPDDGDPNVPPGYNETAMRWQYPYAPGNQYYKDDVVRDDGWLMIANKDTTERAAPQPVGNPAYTLPDIPTWTTYQNNSVIYSGHLYTFIIAGYFRSLRVWVPELNDDTNYNIVIVRNPNSANPILTRINDPILNENAWTTLSADTILVLPGEELLVYIDALNSGGSIQPGGTPADWIREVSSNTIDPTSGGWNTNVQETLLRIHENDADANLIDLTGVIPGSTFQFVDINDPNVSVTYLAQSGETLVGGVYSWTVVIDSIGTNGAPQPTDRCLTTITVPVAAATKFVGIPSYWGPGTLPTWAGIQSFLQYDGVPQAVVGDEAYGIDISFQELVASADWDVVVIGGAANTGASEGGDSVGVTQTFYTATNDGMWTEVIRFPIPPVRGFTGAAIFDAIRTDSPDYYSGRIQVLAHTGDVSYQQIYELGPIQNDVRARLDGTDVVFEVRGFINQDWDWYATIEWREI